jgi:hypothetical protein
MSDFVDFFLQARFCTTGHFRHARARLAPGQDFRAPLAFPKAPTPKEENNLFVLIHLA